MRDESGAKTKKAGSGEIDEEAADVNVKSSSNTAAAALQGRAHRPSGGGTAARALEAARLDGGTLLAHLAQRRDRGEVPSTDFLPTKGSPHVAAALRVAWRTLGRGGRADGGSGARVDKRQYETTHFAISLPSEKCGWNVRTKHPFKNSEHGFVLYVRVIVLLFSDYQSVR